MRLKDKVIIVTGGTSGIGAAIATACVREGAQVLLHGINADEGREVADRLGGAASLFLADLNCPSAPVEITRAALSKFGRIDGLVNNAALIEKSNITELTYEAYQRTMQVNLTAALFLIQATFDELKKSRGSILNIGSVNAYAGESGLLAYSISKAGMQTMTRNLANANGIHGVRVNQINPGWVLTAREDRDRQATGFEEGWPLRLSRNDIPLGAMTTPEQLAEAAIYWLGDESIPFTGTILELEQFSIIGRNPEKL